MLAGMISSLITVWVTFLPCFVFIFAGAPHVERLRDNASLSRALTAISAAVAGVVLDPAVWFALHTAFREVTDRAVGWFHLWIISAVALIVVFRVRTGTLRVIAVCAVLGAIVALAGG